MLRRPLVHVSSLKVREAPVGYALSVLITDSLFTVTPICRKERKIENWWA
jgi:hypothetical protein